LGESILLNLFINIIRHADNPPKNFDEIKGIIAIDEIDVHLHTDLQNSVLPVLIKLFPKIQFIITTHSPLFLLGMSRIFGDDNFEIRNMPNGEIITIERFSEFEKAYSYYKTTKTFEEDIKKLKSGKPLIITEGKTDVRNIKTAWNKLYPEKVFPYEIIDSGIKGTGKNGNTDHVQRMLEYLHSVPLSDNIKIVGIFDNEQDGNGKYRGLQGFEAYNKDSYIRKHLTKNIWGLLLIPPDCRNNFVGDFGQRYFSIEHYFTNDILEKYKMKGNSIATDSQIFSIQGNKSNFAKQIIHEDPKVFEGFRVLFDNIKKILA
jgi:hypothetical protein